MGTAPRELVEAFARGGGVVFVGAGLSMAAGYPDWNTLVQPLRVELVDCPPHASAPEVAQWYELQTSRGHLMERLRRALSHPAARPTDVHRALLGLPLQRLYTSNFDNLIEQSALELRLALDVAVDGADLSVLQADRMQLVKIHGDLAQTRSVTITSDDYELFATRKPALANLLRADLQMQVVLFMGYSFSDDNLRLILAQARQDGGSNPRNRFALVVNPSSGAEAMLRHKGIVPIALSTAAGQDKTSAVAQWLADFAQSVAREPVHPGPPKPATQRTHNLPPVPSGFLGREPELADVVKGLASRYPLVSIEGFAGVGKTSLAIQVGYACAMEGGARPPGAVLFDFVVWVSAKDKPEQPQWFDDVLNAIANTTGYLAISQLPPTEAEKKRHQVDLLLHTFRVLLIIDNLETIHDDALIAWLESVPAPSKVLVTTRNSQLNQKAYAVPLGGLRAAEAMALLKTQVRQLDISPAPSDGRLADLADVTGRNPQAMRLALGLTLGGSSIDEVINGLEGAASTRSVEPLFKGLFQSSWQLMREPARAVLLTTPLFVGVGSIRRDALVATAGLSGSSFDGRSAIEQCEKLGLLESDSVLREGDSEQRFIVHPMTRTFARSRWEQQPAFEPGARARLVTYFRDLVRQSVVRAAPAPAYWNALVGDGMLKVDPEWPSILELMRWCDETGHDDDLFAFTLMLVHYMDSRFHNNDRLHFVKRAVAIAEAGGRRYEEALLRIDALGWTYAEESRFAEAMAEIRAGIAIAQELADGADLLTLAWAWLARIEAEQEHWAQAQEAIERTGGRETPPWIACRVLMARGDIDLKMGAGGKALQSYQAAALASASYGDEGRGYQTKPRIGLAHLATGDYARAEQVFQELTRFDDMVIAELYGEYGLAMIAHQKGEVKGAGALVQDVRERLLRRTSSNLLLNMTHKLQMQLADRRPVRV